MAGSQQTAGATATPIYADDNLGVTPYGGTTTLVTTEVAIPSAGHQLIARYLMYNPSADNIVYWRFGLAGVPLLKNDLTAKSVISRGFDYPGQQLRGAIGESLFLISQNGSPVNYTALVTETAD